MKILIQKAVRKAFALELDDPEVEDCESEEALQSALKRHYKRWKDKELKRQIQKNKSHEALISALEAKVEKLEEEKAKFQSVFEKHGIVNKAFSALEAKVVRLEEEKAKFQSVLEKEGVFNNTFPVPRDFQMYLNNDMY